MNYWAIEQAYRLTRCDLTLRSDWYCTIDIARQQRKVNKLTDKDLAVVTYHWLASIMYHQIPVID
jgi:hypothetical protein